MVSQFVELFEVMEGRQQKTVMMETQMTTMDVHLHELLRLDMYESMATSLVVMNALKHAEMVKTMEGLSVMMETWMIMMVEIVSDILKSDINV